MGCIASFGKCFIIVLNIIFLIIGIVLIAVGAIIRFFPGFLLSFVFAGLEAVTGQFEIGGGASELSDIPLLSDLGLALFLTGIILFSLAIIAFCGTCCKYRVILLLYVIILIIFIIVLSVLGGLFLSRESSLHTTIRDGLVEKVKTEYSGPKGTDALSLAINIMSFTMDCCGISGPSDFDSPHNDAWKTYTYETGGTSYTETIDVTPACCRSDVIEGDSNLDCAKKQGASYDETKTNTKGCYDKLLDLLDTVRIYAIIFLVLVILLLVLLAVLGILVFIDMSNSKVGQV